MACANISVAFTGSSCCDSSSSRPTAPSVSALGCFFSCVCFVLVGVVGVFLARKDFNTNLHRYLTLAIKPERRQGTGSFYCSRTG